MITVKKPILSPMAKAAFEEISTKGGTVEPEDVLWIQLAAQKCVNPSAAYEVPCLIDMPVYIGGAWLHPLSRGAIEWLKAAFGDKWNDTDKVAFALAYAHDPEYLAGLSSVMARLAVWQWRRKLTCSDSALFSAVQFILDTDGCVEVEIETPLQGKAKSSDSNPFHWGDVLCLLCHYYHGTTPNYWLWECSSEFTDMMLAKISRLVPVVTERIDEAKFEAFAEFRSIVISIIARGKP